MSDYLCPICEEKMTIVPGDRVNPKNGVSIVCYNKKCPTTENVEGHGSNAEKAYVIAKEKFLKNYVAR